MPIGRLIIEPLNLLIFRIHGTIVLNEMLEAREKVMTMEGFHTGLDTIRLWDKNVNLSQLSNEQLLKFSTGMKIFNEDTRHVMVAHDALSHGLSRIIVSNRFGGGDATVLSNFEEACTYLDVDSKEIGRSTMYAILGE